MNLTQEVNNYSCAVSNKTARIVKNCPKYEGKWREAATKMNCTAYANNCSEPRRLEYHCVINTSVNHTLEVCSYGQNILQGHCTEFNVGGNIIQPNVRTNCSTFAKNPCPQLYNSNESFKYQGCYELTRKMRTNTKQTESSTKQNVETSSFKLSHGNMSMNEGKGSSNPGVNSIVFSVYALVLLVLTVVAAICLYWKRSHWNLIYA